MILNDDEPDNFLNQDETAEPAPSRPDPDDPFAPVGSAVQEADPHSGRRRHRWRRPLALFIAFVVVALGVAFYIRYMNPYVVDSKTVGYITNVEKRGIVFKTFEGSMISEQSLTDTTRVYSRDFIFSIDNDSLARLIQSYQGTGRRVELTCERFYGTLPWRGASHSVVTGFREM